jgi:hypothetical protein
MLMPEVSAATCTSRKSLRIANVSAYNSWTHLHHFYSDQQQEHNGVIRNRRRYLYRIIDVNDRVCRKLLYFTVYYNLQLRN